MMKIFFKGAGIVSRRQNIMKCFLLILLCLWGGCSPEAPDKGSKHSQTRVVLGTYVTVDVCSSKTEEQRLSETYPAVWTRLEQVESMMNYFDPESELSRINVSYPDTISVHPEIYRLLKLSLKFSELTHGSFDITVVPLIQLWKDAAQKGDVPGPGDIEQARRHVGTHYISLSDDQQVRLLSPDVKLDLAGIAKGYAVDEIARILRAGGFRNFFVDAGGDIYVGGQSCPGRPWRIGIRDPQKKDGIVDIVELTNRAVTTSGGYEQYVEIKGRPYSHIIDPRTGYPQNKIISATVIAPTAQEADALSTALCILPKEEGLELIDSLGDGFAGLLILPRQEGGRMTLVPSRRYGPYRLAPGS